MKKLRFKDRKRKIRYLGITEELLDNIAYMRSRNEWYKKILIFNFI